MYPYYKEDIDKGVITREFAQELIDCIWVKMNDLNKCRDEESAKGFAGYSLFQNLIVGGQNKYGEDVTNDLSFMCIEASKQVFLPQPSLSIRVWNGSPHEFLIKAAELTRTGIGLPAYYNDEVIIPALQNRASLWKMQENTTSSDVLNRRNPVRQTDGMMQRSLICAVRLNLFLQMVWTRVYRLAFRLAMLPR